MEKRHAYYPKRVMPEGWKVGDPLPDTHPWKQNLNIKERTRQAHRGKVARLSDEKRRLDLRIDAGLRDDINWLIDALQWPVSEIIESAINHMRRDLDIDHPFRLSAPEQPLALPDPDEEDVDWRFLDDES